MNFDMMTKEELIDYILFGLLELGLLGSDDCIFQDE